MDRRSAVAAAVQIAFTSGVTRIVAATVLS
jgi:hypothetical protein